MKMNRGITSNGVMAAVLAGALAIVSGCAIFGARQVAVSAVAPLSVPAVTPDLDA